MNPTSGCAKLRCLRLAVCAPSCALTQPLSSNTCCFSNSLSPLQKVWQEERPLPDHVRADCLQLPADLLHQLGDVHSALSHSGNGTDLKLRGGLHTGYEHVCTGFNTCFMYCYFLFPSEHLIRQQWSLTGTIPYLGQCEFFALGYIKPIFPIGLEERKRAGRL